MERRHQETSRLTVTSRLICRVFGGFLAAWHGSGGLLSWHRRIGFRLGRWSGGTGCKPARGFCSWGRGRPLLVLPSPAIMDILWHGLISGAWRRVVIISTSRSIARLGMLRWSVAPLRRRCCHHLVPGAHVIGRVLGGFPEPRSHGSRRAMYPVILALLVRHTLLAARREARIRLREGFRLAARIPTRGVGARVSTGIAGLRVRRHVLPTRRLGRVSIPRTIRARMGRTLRWVIVTSITVRILLRRPTLLPPGVCIGVMILDCW